MTQNKETARMKRFRIMSGVAVSSVVVMVLILQACVAGVQLTPKQFDPAEIKGTYTLILYGCRYADDLENMAILVDEKSAHPLEVFAIDAMYKVKKGLTGQQAMSEANAFINCSMQPVWQSVVRRIPDNQGRTVGYEVKPLYRNITPPEALLSSYSLSEGKVIAYINLDPSLKKEDHFREHMMRQRSR
jgi:hypothetical protein